MSEQRTHDPFGFFKPEPVKLKMLCWTDGQALMWRVDTLILPESWQRVPSEDKEITLP